MHAKLYSRAKIGVMYRVINFYFHNSKDKGPIQYTDSYNLRYFERTLNHCSLRDF
jgi:hypothetical protein